MNFRQLNFIIVAEDSLKYFTREGVRLNMSMNRKQANGFVVIQNAEQLNAFYSNNKNAEWIGFDTEFVGEKRFNTRLCLIQVATSTGNYLIDPFELHHLDPFLEMIVNPEILII